MHHDDIMDLMTEEQDMDSRKSSPESVHSVDESLNLVDFGNMPEFFFKDPMIEPMIDLPIVEPKKIGKDSQDGCKYETKTTTVTTLTWKDCKYEEKKKPGKRKRLSPEEKVRKRREANRLSAALSRERKKKYITGLQQENTELAEKLEAAQRENEKLRKIIQNLSKGEYVEGCEPSRKRRKVEEDTSDSFWTGKTIAFVFIFCIALLVALPAGTQTFGNPLKQTVGQKESGRFGRKVLFADNDSKTCSMLDSKLTKIMKKVSSLGKKIQNRDLNTQRWVLENPHLKAAS